MGEKEIDKKKIESLLPHRKPMLLIDRLINIVHLKSATAIMYVKKNGKLIAKAFPGRAAILIKLLNLNEKHISSVYEITPRIISPSSSKLIS